jgi:hypothetical protein
MMYLRLQGFGRVRWRNLAISFLGIFANRAACFFAASEETMGPRKPETMGLNLPPPGFNSIGSFLRDQASRQPLLLDPTRTPSAPSSSSLGTDAWISEAYLK